MAYVVIAGNYESVDGQLEENVKYVSEEYATLKDAENDLDGCYGYHFSYIENTLE